MDLQTYLTKSSSRPNKQILQSLGATEEQIKYIMETPENFNWNVWDGFSSEKSGPLYVIIGGLTQEEADTEMASTFGDTITISLHISAGEIRNAVAQNREIKCGFSKYFGETLGYVVEGDAVFENQEGTLAQMPTFLSDDSETQVLKFQVGNWTLEAEYSSLAEEPLVLTNNI